MKLVERINVDENFWILNPEVKYFSPFTQLFDEDLSKNKEKSSKIMWAIFLFTDPASKFNRLAAEDKEVEIKNNYLKDEDFTFEEDTVKLYVEAYKNLLLSKAQREFLNWERKIEERNKFLAGLTYDVDTFDTLDKMLVNSSKIWEQYQKIKAQMEEEDSKSQLKGGRKESKSERGEI